MKVVSVLTSDAAGGAEFAAVRLLAALAGRGHEAVLVTDRAGICAGTPVREVPIALGPKLSTRTYASLAARWPLLVRRLRSALEAEAPYDVLLVHFKKEQLLVPWLPAPLRPAVAWAEWGPVPFPLRRGVPGAAYRRAARGVRAVVCVSEGTRRSVVEAGVPAARVHVLPNVVSAGDIRFRPEARARIRTELGVGDDAFVVGCMSRFHPKKRNDVLIDAVVALDDARVHLVLAGEGETEEELRARAAPLGDRAHFVPTPGDRASELLSGCDLAAFCPSPTEGEPLAIVVPMLCGRPVVSGGAEGALGLIEPGAGAIAQPDHDPAAMAALIAAYRDDPARLAREGAEARRRAAAAHDAAAIAARAEALLNPSGPAA